MRSSADPFYSHSFGASAPWLDLVNSEHRDGFGKLTDHLDDVAWIRSFSRHWNFRFPPSTPAPQKALRELRSLLRRLVEKAAAHGALHREDVAPLNSWLKVAVFPRVVENQNRFELSLQPVHIGWPAVLAKIAASFGGTLIQEQAGRLKICANIDCRWVFIDRTKANIRRWCDDATCGNRDRVRRSRANHKK
jgi:predicted RNA-binding Zn ribbon-like protein